MISTTIFSAVALTIGGGHAGLHPANTNFYLEVPEVRELLATYDEAPLARLIADPEVQLFVAQLTGQEPEQVTLKNLTRMGLDELRAELPEVGLQVLDMVTGVEHASLSLSGVDFDGIYALISSSEGEVTDELLGRLSGVRALVVVDFTASETATKAASLIRENARAQADEVDAAWTMVTHHVATDEQPEEWSTHANSDAEVELSMFVGNLDNRLTLSFGVAQDTELHPVVGATLADRESYQKAGIHFKDEGGVTIVGSYFSLSGIDELPKLWAMMPDMPDGLPQLAEFAFQQLAPSGKFEVRSHTRLVKGRFITETFEPSFAGPDTPQLTSDEPVTKSNFRMAPPDAVAVWSMNMDKDGMRRLLLDGLGQLSGEDPQAVLAKLDSDYGFQPERDLIAPLGGELVFYTMPFAGIGMPKMFVALELEDSESFARGMQGVAEYLQDVAGDAIEIRSKPYRKQPFMSFSPGESLVDMSGNSDPAGMAAVVPALVTVSASIGILEDRAIIALSSMFAKREIKRLLKAPDDEHHPVMTSAEEFPAGVRSYGVTDWGSILGGLYDSVLGFLPLIEQGADISLPFSIDELPDSSIFSRYIEPSINWTQAVEGGTYMRDQSAFGPEIPFMLGAAGSAAMLLAFTEGGEEYVYEIAAEPKATARTPQSTTRDTLQELKVAVQIYKAEHGHLPADLEDLLEGTANFPRGLLGSASLPTDHWGNRIHYGAAADGTSYRIWSSGADGEDNAGEGDDLLLQR